MPQTKFDPPDEKYPETLIGGPLDGLLIDVWPDRNDCWPGPHHRREHGVVKPVLYTRRTDGRLHWLRETR
jgi:hypothetical protein